MRLPGVIEVVSALAMSKSTLVPSASATTIRVIGPRNERSVIVTESPDVIVNCSGRIITLTEDPEESPCPELATEIFLPKTSTLPASNSLPGTRFMAPTKVATNAEAGLL